MGNKLDILNDYQVAEKKAAELSSVCANICNLLTMRNLEA